MSPIVLQAARVLVFAAFALTSVIAITTWAVRNRRLNAFGAWPRLVRSAARPLIAPMERRLVRSGGNPQDAPYWLLGIVVGGGLVLLSLLQWLLQTIGTITFSLEGGPRSILRLLVGGALSLVMIALWIRVIASWLGISPYRPWMRPVNFLTSWLIEPIRRLLPPFGMLDFSPVVAMILVWLLRQVLLSLL